MPPGWSRATASGTEISTMGAGRKPCTSSSNTAGYQPGHDEDDRHGGDQGERPDAGAAASRTPGPGCHRRLMPSRPMVRCQACPAVRCQAGDGALPGPAHGALPQAADGRGEAQVPAPGGLADDRGPGGRGLGVGPASGGLAPAASLWRQRGLSYRRGSRPAPRFRPGGAYPLVGDRELTVGARVPSERALANGGLGLVPSRLVDVLARGGLVLVRSSAGRSSSASGGLVLVPSRLVGSPGQRRFRPGPEQAGRRPGRRQAGPRSGCRQACRRSAGRLVGVPGARALL